MNKLLRKYKSFPVQVKASFWFLICSFLQKGISMIVTPIFTRIMNTSEYGQFGVFNSWYGIISVFVSLNLFYGVHVQGIVKFKDEKKVFTSSLQGLTTVLITIWTIIYLAFHNFWNQLLSLTTIQMLGMMIIIWATAVFTFWANEQRAIFSYRMLVAISIIVAICKPVLGIILVVISEDKVTARIMGWVIIELLAYTWIYIYQFKKGKVFFSNSADRIMIERMIGSSESGIYNLAYSISLIMVLFNTALAQTITPWMYQKIHEKRNQDISPIGYITLIMIAIVNLCLILLAPEVIAFFAPEPYHAAVWVVPPVAMSVFFMYSFDLFARFAFYYEKTKIIMIASVSGALLNIFLNFIFIRIYGYIAAGYTTLLCFMVYSLVHYIFMRKVCRDCCEGVYPFETKTIIGITIPFVVLGFILMITYNYPLIRYGLVVIAIFVAILKRKKITCIIKDILSLKKQNKNTN